MSKGTHGPVWARQAMAPPFGYPAAYTEAVGLGWSPEVQMAEEDGGKNNGDRTAARKTTPSPPGGVAKLGRQLSDMKLHQPGPTFTKLRNQLQPPDNKSSKK